MSAFHKGESTEGYFDGATDEQELEQRMKDRLRVLLKGDFIKKGRKTQVALMHEDTIYEYSGVIGWEKTAYYRMWGNQWPSKALVFAYEILDELGLEAGNDVEFAWSDYDLAGNSIKANAMASLVDSSSRGAEKALDNLFKQGKLNQPIERVNVTILSQEHMHADVENARGWNGLYTENMNPDVISKNLKTVGGKGNKVEIIEIDVSGAKSPDEKATSIATLVSCAVNAGCQSVDFFEPIRFEDPSQKTLFNREQVSIKKGEYVYSYIKTSAYYGCLRALLDHVTGTINS